MSGPEPSSDELVAADRSVAAAGGLPAHGARSGGGWASRLTGSRSLRDRRGRGLIAMAVVVHVLSGRGAAHPGQRGPPRLRDHALHLDPGRATSRSTSASFVDTLTACLLIVVTTIGLLVHVYSIGYMSHDPGYWRFFAYLNLFMFSMLLLVLAGHWLVSSSPGSWSACRATCSSASGTASARRRWPARRRSSSTASATSASRSGSWPSSSTRRGRRRLDIRRVDRASCSDAGQREPDPAVRRRPAALRGRDGQERPVPAARLAAGRDGGPDPGVRPHPRRDDGQRRRLPRRPRQPALRHAPRTRWSSSPAIGIFTAILAASIAMTQTDIKRVLAYSTLSQLGYMFAGARRRGLHGRDLPPDDPRLLQGPAVPRLGLGHPRRPRGAGHAQDGRPAQEDPDHLLDDAHRRRSPSPASRRWPASSARTRSSARRSSSASSGSGSIGLIVAGMTAFYMFRLMGMTFWGEFRGPKAVWDKIHESPPVDDHPAHPAGHPVGLPRHVPGPAARRQHGSAAGWSRSSREGEAILGHAEVEYSLFGIDGVLILAERRPWPRRHRPRLAAASASTSARCTCRPGPSASARSAARAAVPVPRPRSTSGGSTTSTTCCSWSSAGGSPTRCGGSTGTSSTARQRHRPGDHRRRAAASARSRPAGSRTTPWASPSGSS